MHDVIISLTLTFAFIWTITDSGSSAGRQNQNLPDEYDN